MLKTIGYSDRNTFHEYVQYMYENRKQQLVNAHGVPWSSIITVNQNQNQNVKNCSKLPAPNISGKVQKSAITMQSKKSQHCFSVFFFIFFFFSLKKQSAILIAIHSMTIEVYRVVKRLQL